MVYLDHETTEEDLAAQLPSFMPKDPESGNFKLLKAIAERIDATAEDLESVDRAASPQYADTMDQLERLADLVNLTPRQGESKEHFRARVISEYQLVTSEGTVDDLLSAVATILDTDVRNIQYTETHVAVGGRCRINVPQSRLALLALSDSEFAEIVRRLIAASYVVDIIKTGTFTYISPEDYNNQLSTASEGYDGLDSNGDRKGNGGTYAGVL